MIVSLSASFRCRSQFLLSHYDFLFSKFAIAKNYQSIDRACFGTVSSLTWDLLRRGRSICRAPLAGWQHCFLHCPTKTARGNLVLGEDSLPEEVTCAGRRF